MWFSIIGWEKQSGDLYREKEEEEGIHKASELCGSPIEWITIEIRWERSMYTTEGYILIFK